MNEHLTIGVFYAWDFLAVIFTTIAYFACPARILNEKNEYVKFFLLFLSVFFLVSLIVKNIIPEQQFANSLVLFGIFPLLFLAHLIYPFKTVKRNQHASFFLFFAALYALVLGGILIFFDVFWDFFGRNM